MAPAGTAAEGAPAPGEDRLLLEWMDRQYEVSAASMLRAVSATHLVKERRGFGQTIRPARGSILASTAIGAWDPDPDYFFHWLRDSAVVIDALRELIADGTLGEEGFGHCKDFVAFSHVLNCLDGADFLRRAGDFRKDIDPGFLQFVRDDSDLRGICGDRVLGEPRFNPDATLDISKWSRPQHDGPAMRALALLRFWPLAAGLDEAARAALRFLILTDLGFIRRHWQEPSFDIWEEELGLHYYTKLLQHGALLDGANWLEETGSGGASRQAEDWRAIASEIAQSLNACWCPDRGFYVSRREVAHGESGKDLDFAVILAVIHAKRNQGAHSVLDPKVMTTMARLEDLFDASYPINESRAPHLGPAMGRYAGDNYFSGGAYYFSTLGAAEFYYALAEAVARGADLPISTDNADILRGLGALRNFSACPPQVLDRGSFEAILCRGDQFMATVAAFTPASGELSEQFDKATGIQTSAKTLSWSHAAFITALARRRAAMGRANRRSAQTGTA